MPQDHLPDEILMICAEAPESLTAPEAVRAHLDGCESCRQRVDDYRGLAAEMSDPAAWAAADDLDVEGQGQAALARFEARIANEDADAERLLAGVRNEPLHFPIMKLLGRQRLYTGGVVRLLCQWAHEKCDDEPLLALVLAETATAFADRLSDDFYPAGGVYELRGTAWKEYASACIAHGSYDEAFGALARAERAYKHLLAPQIGLATIDLARAIAFTHTEQYDDALRHARKAAEAFARAGDTSRYLDSKQVEALVYHRKLDFQAAAAAYWTLYEAGMNAGDAGMVARAAQNLGVVHVERGDVGTASRYFLEALHIVEELGLKARAARCRWGIAWVALAAGNSAEADRRFIAVEEEMEALGMSDTAAMKLQHAEALLMLGRKA
ncbi:MAG: hypothetical protein JWO56_1163 [Acidobacteria bacterium]|nr:hypothetical protein [Acidobacteriota bacterium]